MSMLRLVPFGLLATFLSAPAMGAAPSDRPVLAELFTSQSCSSCPPAEALFHELADDPSLVTLEWHVDYWDDLVYGRYGVWKDPWSDAAFTERQRRYNAEIRGTRAVYTPQAVIGGTAEVNGARRSAVYGAVRNISASDASLSFTRVESDRLAVTAISAEPAEGWVAYFVRDIENEVPRGENHGRELGGRHVVRKLVPLGKVRGEVTYQIALPEEGMGCAVIIQAPGPGPVHAAAYCP
ncbi:DUF1223 domain-containing protein [Parvularcula marina]|uniref:DUF1223 domain-containing protein n=2 Tax=Parvularcula marina TaxID=2292771 RepID=A0A371RIR1_9PROT|nr:DUF1223 domain-containing protein [Parvularcula marina]